MSTNLPDQLHYSHANLCMSRLQVKELLKCIYIKACEGFGCVYIRAHVSEVRVYYQECWCWVMQREGNKYWPQCGS